MVLDQSREDSRARTHTSAHPTSPATRGRAVRCAVSLEARGGGHALLLGLRQTRTCLRASQSEGEPRALGKSGGS